MEVHRILGGFVALLLLGTVAPSFASTVATPDQAVGSKCRLENEEISKSAKYGGSQMCVLTTKGLFWKESTYMVATPRMNKMLPKCGSSRGTNAKLSSKLDTTLTSVATAYFQKQNLLPIKVSQIVGVSVMLNSVGIHACSNGVDAPLGGWGGSIPVKAKAAWLLPVNHKINRFGNFDFLYVALVGGKYLVVGEGTGP